jgi:hypothetical protein
MNPKTSMFGIGSSMLDVFQFNAGPEAGAPPNCAKRHNQLCHIDAFGTVYYHLYMRTKHNSILCLQGFRVVFGIAAPLLHWNREQTTNF